MSKHRSLLLSFLALAASAHGAHITDKLAVGLHDAPAPEAALVKILTSGTPIEVLERQGAFARVRLSDNTTGWIEKRYVTEERPARAMLVEAQARAGRAQKQAAELERILEETKRQLRAARQEIASIDDAPGNATPTSQIDPPRELPAAALARAREQARQALAALPQNAGSPLAAPHQALKDHLERIVEILDNTLPVSDGHKNPGPSPFGLWQWPMFAGFTLAGFIGGALLTQYLARRRSAGVGSGWR